jgi:23S rRNA (uracil1939-C5)-methyltransferase
VHEVFIHSMGTAGEGIGRLESGQVVFVEGGLPGDLVEVRLTRKRKRVQHAEVARVIAPSSQRVESECPVDACSGCPIRWLSRGAQAEAKRDRVVQTLRRIAKQDVDELLGDVVQLGDGWRYRHRVRLHAERAEGRWRLGYHARRSHRLVPLETCPVLVPELETTALAVADAVALLPEYAALREVELMVSRRDQRAAARIEATGAVQAFKEPSTWFENAGLAGVEVVTPDEIWRHGDLELRFDHARADEFDLVGEPGVFTQANPAINDALVAAVLAELPVDTCPRVLELHAGIGNFSLPLAKAGAIVFTAEHMQRAVKLAQRNAEQAGISLHAYYLEDIDALERGGPVPPLSDFDAVLLNPPRVGAFGVAKALARSGPAHLAYVSCDPATLARDVKELVAGGYEITAATAFDMFPQTPHVEVLLTLHQE